MYLLEVRVPGIDVNDLTIVTSAHNVIEGLGYSMRTSPDMTVSDPMIGLKSRRDLTPYASYVLMDPLCSIHCKFGLVNRVYKVTNLQLAAALLSRPEGV